MIIINSGSSHNDNTQWKIAGSSAWVRSPNYVSDQGARGHSRGHSKKVVGSSPASCNMSGLVPGPFCVEFACSPRVHPGSPHRTPTIKTCKKSRCSSVLTLTKSGPSTWTWSPGAASLAAHCSWLSLGEDARMGKCRKHLPPSSHLHVCVCVCHHSYVCNAVWHHSYVCNAVWL